MHARWQFGEDESFFLFNLRERVPDEPHREHISAFALTSRTSTQHTAVRWRPVLRSISLRSMRKAFIVIRGFRIQAAIIVLWHA